MSFLCSSRRNLSQRNQRCFQTFSKYFTILRNELDLNRPLAADGPTERVLCVTEIQSYFTPLCFYLCFQVKQEGVAGLFKGVVPVMIRAFPANAVSEELWV